MVRKSLHYSWVYLISRWSTISYPLPTPLCGSSAPLTGLYQLPVFSSHNGLIEKAANTVSSFLTKTLSRLIEKDVSPPLLGAQRHAWG